jgi:hypothetical protein
VSARTCHCGRPAYKGAYGWTCGQWPYCEIGDDVIVTETLTLVPRTRSTVCPYVYHDDDVRAGRACEACGGQTVGVRR